MRVTTVHVVTTIGGRGFGGAGLAGAGTGVVVVTSPEIRRTTAPPATTTTAPAFDAFYRAEFPRIVAIAQSLTGDRHVAEELAQEGFIAAHYRWSKVGAYDRPGDWVRRVVTNRAISIFRRRAAEHRALARSGPTTDVVELPDDDSWLWQQVRALPARQAQAIALVYVDDLPLERVATILGCGETTVKTHLSRGRQALARAIEARDAIDRAQFDASSTSAGAHPTSPDPTVIAPSTTGTIDVAPLAVPAVAPPSQTVEADR